MTKDAIWLSPATAAAFTHHLGYGEFNCIEMPARMAAAVWLLRTADDTGKLFPHGKWETISSIDVQLQQWAEDRSRAEVTP